MTRKISAEGAELLKAVEQMKAGKKGRKREVIDSVDVAGHAR